MDMIHLWIWNYQLVKSIIQTFLSVSLYVVDDCIENGIPVPEMDQNVDGDCIWEYDILGLWSIGIAEWMTL